MKKVKLQYSNSKQYFLTVPKAIAEVNGWEKGKELYWVKGKEGLMLVEE